MDNNHAGKAPCAHACPFVRIATVLSTIALTLASPAAWDFRMIATPNGNWINEIESLLEDSTGAVWVATWGEGLHKFDRTAWETYREESGFLGDWQRCLVSDDTGAVWVGTADGICRFQDGEPVFITQENTPSIASHGVTAMLRDQDGRILFGTEQGYIYTTETAPAPTNQPIRWRVLADPEVTAGASVADLEQTKDGRLWASLKLGGVYVLNQGQWSQVGGLPSGRSDQMTADGRDGQLWTAHEFGRAPLFEIGSGEASAVMDFDTGVNCFATDHSGTLHAGTDNGLYRLNGHEWQAIDLGPNMGRPNVRAIHFASDGALWVGCLEGLLRGTQQTFVAVAGQPGDTGLRGVVADPKTGSGTALTTRSTLRPLRGGQLHEEVFLGTTYPGGPRDWAMGKSGSLWILYVDGRCVAYDTSSGESVQEVPKPEAYEALAEPLMRLFSCSDGRLLFYGDAGVHELVDGGWKFVERKGTDSPWEHVSTVAEGPDGALYFGGYESVTVWRDGRVEDLETAYRFALGDSAHSLLVDEAGSLWIGTHGSGVYRVGSERVWHYTREDGLRSDSVSRMYQAPNGAIWAAYRRRGAGRFFNGHWQNFDLDQGLPNSAIAQVVSVARDEHWFLSEEGRAYRFNPDREPPNTWIVAAPGRVDSHGVASFSYGGWDAWNHTPPRRLRYATRIIRLGVEESSTPWSSYGDSSTFVTPALGRGNYRFEVRAVDENGNPDPTPAFIQYTVLPPLWEKPGFWLPLLCAALLGLFFLVSWLRDFYRLRQSQTALEGVNDMLLAEIERRDSVERALRDSEAHLEEAQGLARIGSWSLDLRTNKSVWSRELFQIYDLDPANGVPGLSAFIKLVHPDDQKAMRLLIPKLLETRTPQELEFRGSPERGPLRYFHCRARVVEDERGEPRYLTGTNQDITQQRNAEMARMELEEKLRHAQKLEAVGRLAGGIAHDFNNILHALLGYCQIARDRGIDDRALLAECLDAIESGGSRASDLVRQLLTFSRRDQVRLSTQHLEPIIDEALLLLRRTLPSTIEIRRDIAPLCHPVHADATQVHQVVLNLCTNAAHAMEASGGILRLDVRNQERVDAPVLSTGELSPGEYVCLTVQDTGPGIPPAVLDRVFDPFFTTKDTGQGTGLGLATVHGIVTALGGGVDIESSPGRGTTFRVYFPRSEAPVVEEAMEDPVQTGMGNGRILLVDDEPSIARLSKLALQNQGFDVDAFTEPAEALAAFASEPSRYCTVVTDFTMPQLTGLALAERISEMAPGTPVLLVSGRLDGDVEASPYVREVLRKPLPMARLVEAVLRYADDGNRARHTSGTQPGEGGRSSAK